MSAKHRTAEYQRNARTIRAGVDAIHARGGSVTCWRCRRPIMPGTPYDVGHVTGATGSTRADLAPEHRHRAGGCPGNRRDGGKAGAARTNARHAPNIPKGTATTWKV